MRTSLRARSLALGALLTAVLGAGAAGQAAPPPIADNQVYIGGHGGIILFETESQTRGAIPAFGGHLLVNLKRVGFLVQVTEGIGSTERGSYYDPTSPNPGNVRNFTFNDIRIWNGMVMVMPIRSPVQPYFGVGYAFMQVVNPTPSGFFASQFERDQAKRYATRLSNYGAASFVAGLQFRVDRFSAFGAGQVFTAAPTKTLVDEPTGATLVAEGRGLVGPTFTLTAGLRIGLGSAKANDD